MNKSFKQKVDEIYDEIVSFEKRLQLLNEEFFRIKQKIVEISNSEMTITCPHLLLYPSIVCVYLLDNNCCEDIETCPGNSDSWCSFNLEKHK